MKSCRHVNGMKEEGDDVSVPRSLDLSLSCAENNWVYDALTRGLYFMSF